MAVRVKFDTVVYANGLGNAPSRIASFYGSSQDTKPTSGILNGSSFTEVDTGKFFWFNESSGDWVEDPTHGGGGSGELVATENQGVVTLAVE